MGGKMKIIVPEKRKLNGVVRYAEVKGSNGETYYVVLRRKYLVKKTYVCSCPGFIFHGKPCKHIKAFKEEEKRLK